MLHTSEHLAKITLLNLHINGINVLLLVCFGISRGYASNTKRISVSA